MCLSVINTLHVHIDVSYLSILPFICSQFSTLLPVSCCISLCLLKQFCFLSGLLHLFLLSQPFLISQLLFSLNKKYIQVSYVPTMNYNITHDVLNYTSWAWIILSIFICCTTSALSILFSDLSMLSRYLDGSCLGALCNRWILCCSCVSSLKRSVSFLSSNSWARIFCRCSLVEATTFRSPVI